MGFFVTYLLKRFRSVTHSAIHETFLLICFAMLTYYLSEIAEQSGIASLVTCALVEAHYAWYNLSPQGKHVTSVAFQTFGYGAESFVFSFIGLSLMFYTDYPYSWQFICAEFFIIIIGRYAAICLSYYMFACFKGDQSNKLSFREITFLSYAAFIRGCIAFGLVENLDGEKFHNKKVIVSSVLCLVISSTCIIGSFTALFKNWVMPSPDAKYDKNLHHSINRASPKSSNEFEFEEAKDKQNSTFGNQLKPNAEMKAPLNPKQNPRASLASHYSEFKHPNMMSVAISNNFNYRMDDVSDYSGGNAQRAQEGCMYFFKKFDDQILRPILIYKYRKNKHKPEINFDLLLTQQEKFNEEMAENIYRETMNMTMSKRGSHGNFNHNFKSSYMVHSANHRME